MTIPDLAAVKDTPRVGLAELVLTYGDTHVRPVPDGQGGVWIEIDRVVLGDTYAQDASFLICHLPFNLPAADVYPLFLRSDLTRCDGQLLGEGFALTAVSWPGDAQPRPVVQVSRRTRGNFALQTPLQKIDKVLDWIRSR